MIGEYLEQYSYRNLLKDALSRVPDELDKREGSIIYDALAPACYMLSEYYMQLRQILKDTFVTTANGEYLDLRVAEQGISRFKATHAVKKANFKTASGEALAVPVGSRFSTISETKGVNYYVSEPYADASGTIIPGEYRLICEEIGSIGNGYNGSLLPISYINGLATATMSDLLIAGQDIESDDELRTRYFKAVNEKPFGGNVAQYIEEIKSIDGIGGVQVYPVWAGGGTVKCSAIDSDYNPLSEDAIGLIQNLIDPQNEQKESGIGLGIAPIGHKVTIATPNPVTIDIRMSIMLEPAFSLEQVRGLVENVISDYLLSIRQVWDRVDTFNNHHVAVYISRINSAVLSVPGIVNVTNTRINGSEKDMILKQDAKTQELPMKGKVTIDV